MICPWDIYHQDIPADGFAWARKHIKKARAIEKKVVDNLYIEDLYIYLDEGNDGLYGSGSRDGVATTNQDDIKYGKRSYQTFMFVADTTHRGIYG